MQYMYDERGGSGCGGAHDLMVHVAYAISVANSIDEQIAIEQPYFLFADLRLIDKVFKKASRSECYINNGLYISSQPRPVHINN